ncbi:hypothetical protein F4703DRAFT_1947047 [Phycomyces blakesleeanus]
MNAATPFRALTVKASINATGPHNFQIRTYALSKHIFLSELALDPFFDLNGWIDQPFFVEVFLSLIDWNTGSSRITERTRLSHELVSHHINTYIHNSSYTRISLLNAHQSAMYEATKIHVVYIVNIKMGLGQKFRRIINILLAMRRRQRGLTKHLGKQGATREQIKRMLTQNIFQPIIMFKEKASTRRLEDVFTKEGYRNAFMAISPILTFFCIVQLLGKLGHRCFNCFPLRRSWFAMLHAN